VAASYNLADGSTNAWLIPGVPAGSQVRVRATAWTSGTANVTLTSPGAAAWSASENLIRGALPSDLITTAATQLLPAQGAGLRNYITSLLVTNDHSTQDTRVDILDGTTLLWTGFAAHGGGGYSMTFPSPLRGSPNTAVNVQCSIAAQVRASAAGFKGA
jgi:hypothetical protein